MYVAFMRADVASVLNSPLNLVASVPRLFASYTHLINGQQLHHGYASS